MIRLLLSAASNNPALAGKAVSWGLKSILNPKRTLRINGGSNDFKGLKSAQEGAKPIIRLVTSNSEYITGKVFREEGK
jgi:hypothetical protein